MSNTHDRYLSLEALEVQKTGYPIGFEMQQSHSISDVSFELSFIFAAYQFYNLAFFNSTCRIEVLSRVSEIMKHEINAEPILHAMRMVIQ